jgi:transcription elongation factor Elf1
MLLDPKALIPTTFYADNQGVAETVCPRCGLSKSVNVSQYKDFTGLFSINCDCGQDYKCRFDFKRLTESISLSTTLPKTNDPQEFIVDSQGLATILCPVCGKKKIAKVPSAAGPEKIFNLRCGCGASYKARFTSGGENSSVLSGLSEDMPTPIFPIQNDNTASVICPSCGVTKKIRMPAGVDPNKDYSISCACGAKFKCRFEKPMAEPELEAEEEIPFLDLESLLHESGPRVFYADANDVATIICPHCGLSKTFRVPDTIRPETVLKVDCKCGQPFKCRFEFHNPKRKIARVPGSYFFLEKDEMKDRDPVVYFANASGDAVIVCHSCGFSKPVNANADKNLSKRLGFHCVCGNVFPFRVDLRREFRKRVNLAGKFKNAKTGRRGLIYVRDLSMGGVGFSVQVTNEDTSYPIRIGDHLELVFRLDDRIGTEIVRTVTVCSVRENFVGSKFHDRKSYDKELGFYLMP